MSQIMRTAVLSLAAAFLISGCGSSDNPTQPGSADDPTTGIVHGEIGADLADFEFVSEVLDGPDGPEAGSFLVRGQNLHYDTDLGALVVDLTVTNVSEYDYPEPVNLTFLQLLPPEVTVLNADNGQDGIGASFLFGFANDDAVWTPGEESLPRTVQFGVDPGVSIGFVVRVDVGMDPAGGAIGGMVWHDVDEDGSLDPDEAGIGDVAVGLYQGVNDSTDVWITLTAQDGTYRFDGLSAGYYTVVRLERDDLVATTPTEIQVLLVEENGDVADFLLANFGCLIVDPPDTTIAVGDCIHAKGDYAAEPDRLNAELLCLCGSDGDDDDDDDDGGADCWNRLSGPVTAIDLDENALAVMGTWVSFAGKADLDLEDIAIGDRVRVNVEVVSDDQGDHLIGCRLESFNGNFDRVRALVQEVIHNDEGNITQLRVLNTLIDVPADYDCDD
jgi:hypothetical protein